MGRRLQESYISVKMYQTGTKDTQVIFRFLVLNAIISLMVLES